MVKVINAFSFDLISILLGGASDRSFNVPETFYDSILEFNPDTKVWAQIGVMTRPRAHHGVTIVNFEEFKSVCTL